jgi:hypothetical protein
MILAFILACAPVPTDAGPIGSTSADPVAGGVSVTGMPTVRAFTPEPGVRCFGWYKLDATYRTAASAISCVVVPVEPR